MTIHQHKPNQAQTDSNARARSPALILQKRRRFSGWLNSSPNVPQLISCPNGDKPKNKAARPKQTGNQLSIIRRSQKRQRCRRQRRDPGRQQQPYFFADKHAHGLAGLRVLEATKISSSDSASQRTSSG